MGKAAAPSFSFDDLPCQLLGYFGRSIFSLEVLNCKEDTVIEVTGATVELQQGYLTLQQSNFRSRVLGLKSTVELRFEDGREPEKYVPKSRGGSTVVLDRAGSSKSSRAPSLGKTGADIAAISKVFVDNSKNSDVQKKRLEDSLYSLLCSPEACPPHILVALRCPEIEGMRIQPRVVDLGNSRLQNCKKGLNSSQLDAWQHMLSTEPLSAVIGPPGTGKTTLIGAVAKAWDKLAGTREILLCAAHQNVAVRHMAETMVKERIPRVLLLISEDFYVDWHEEQYRQVKDCIVISGQQVASGLESWAARNRRDSPRIVLCTLALIGSQSFYACLMKNEVTSMIIDECSQAAEGALIAPLMCLRELRTLSVLGDPNQLPPFGTPPMQSVFDLISSSCNVKLLQEQYRMPPCISDFVSAQFYDGRLSTAVTKNRYQDSDQPLVWVNVSGSANLATGSTSLCNASEAEAIVSFCKQQKSASSSSSVGSKLVVLTLYEGQRRLIQKLLRESEMGFLVFNVDSFQGQEADIVLISLVVGDRMSPFATGRNRACVLLSRAKRLLYVFGNVGAVKGNARAGVWRSLADY